MLNLQSSQSDVHFTTIVSVYAILVDRKLTNCSESRSLFAFTSIVSPHAAFVNARLLLDAGPKCVYNYRISVAIVVKATVPLSARDIVVYNHCIYSFL